MHIDVDVAVAIEKQAKVSESRARVLRRISTSLHSRNSTSPNVFFPRPHVFGYKIPAVLHACRHSRLEARKFYTRFHCPSPLRSTQVLPAFWYDYEKDWFYLNHEFAITTPFYAIGNGPDQYRPNFLSNLACSVEDLELDKIKKIAIYIQRSNPDQHNSYRPPPIHQSNYTAFWSDHQRLFPNITNIKFIMSTGRAKIEDLTELTTYDQEQSMLIYGGVVESISMIGTARWMFVTDKCPDAHMKIWARIRNDTWWGKQRQELGNEVILSFVKFGNEKVKWGQQARRRMREPGL